MSVVGSGSRLGCSKHVERGICTNRRTVARDALLERTLVGFKERLLAPELIDEFIRAYAAEAKAANQEQGSRRASLQVQAANSDRQIRNLLDLRRDGRGGGWRWRPNFVTLSVGERPCRRRSLRGDAGAGAKPQPEPAGLISSAGRGAGGGAGRSCDNVAGDRGAALDRRRDPGHAR